MGKTIFLACLVALPFGAMAGCDDDAPLDAGPRPIDGGLDAGTDAGTDAGPTPTFRIRLVNDLPGLVGGTDEPGSVHICSWFSNGGSIVRGSTRFLTQSLASGIPFRGPSPYLEFPVIGPLDYLVGVYDVPELGDPASCPNDPDGTVAPAYALLATITPDRVPEGAVVTVVLSGLAADTLGASGGALPSICNAAGARPTFDQPCTTAAEAFVYADDPTTPAAGMTRLRVMNQVANSTPPSGWTLCYDPGVVPMSDPTAGCADTTPGAGDHEALASAVRYGEATAYADRAPILPAGSPAPGIGGGLYLHLEDGAGCRELAAGSSCYPILAAFPPPTMGADPIPDEVRPALAADAIHTIFISGLLPPGAPFSADFGVSFMVWQDDFVAP